MECIREIETRTLWTALSGFAVGALLGAPLVLEVWNLTAPAPWLLALFSVGVGLLSAVVSRVSSDDARRSPARSAVIAVLSALGILLVAALKQGVATGGAFPAVGVLMDLAALVLVLAGCAILSTTLTRRALHLPRQSPASVATSQPAE